MNPHPGPLEGVEQFVQQAAFRAAQSGEPERFAKLAERLRVLTDNEIAKVQASAAPPACKPGCNWCCHRLVVTTLPEIYSIAQAVRAWPQDRQAGLHQKLIAHEEAMDGYWRYETDVYSRACPFLDGGLCQIYGERPISCRSMSSYDADRCRERMEGDAPSVPEVPGQSQVGGSIMAPIAHAFLAAGRSSGTFDLSFAMLKVFDDPKILDSVARGGEELEAAIILSPHRRQEVQISREAHEVAQAPYFGEYRRLALIEPEVAWELLEPHRQEPIGALGRLMVAPIYKSTDHLEEWWVRLGDSIDELLQTKLDPKIAFEAILHFYTFFWAYSGKNVRPYLERFMTHAHNEFALKAYPELASPIEIPRRPGKFRLGYISRRLIGFNGSRWALGWLAGQSPEIETFAFNLNNLEDDVSIRWRHCADHYYHLPAAVSTVAPFIRSLDLDALIITDIGMDGTTMQLSLLRLARTQMTGWGHPVTSGSPALDYYLSSELMEPPDGDEHYSERLIRLPGSGLCYPRAELAPSAKSRAELGLPESGYIFNAQRGSKLLPKYDSLYREIAERSGKPIVFINFGDHEGGAIFKERIRTAGINAVVLERLDSADFIRVIQLADLVLDAPGWNGGNTTVEALVMGTPIVSIAGEFMRGRHCLAFMAQAGVEDLIAKDEREYVELALDGARQVEVMKGRYIEPIYGAPAPVRAIEKLLLG